MANHNYNHSDSSSDDDELNAEIEALSRACLPNTNDTVTTSSDIAPCNSEDTTNFKYKEDGDGDEDEDQELFRRMEEEYGEPLSLKPIMSLPPSLPDDDDDDDLDLLLAIRQSYSDFTAPSSAPPPNDDDDLEMISAIRRQFSQNDPDLAVACDSGPSDAKGSRVDSCVDKSFSKDAHNTPFWSESFNVHRDQVEHDPYDAEKEEASTSYPSFPRVAQMFMKAIKKNRSFQKFIRNNMLHIESRMEEIKELRKRLKTFRDFQVKCKKKVGHALSQKQDARIQLISVPKQRANAKGIDRNASAMCYGPLENSYVASYKAALAKFPLSFHREKWLEEERQSLEKGLIQQYQEMLLQKSTEALSDPNESGFTHGVDGMISLIRNQEITPEIIHHFSNEVNWKHLASLHLPRRSGEECEARWLNHESRLINRDKWTPEEDKRLLFLIQQNGIQNWNFIAKKLDTNRTPFQCLARYQRSLNASIMRRDWTEDEDAQLRSAVESFGESNWQAVASVLEGRTGTQCSNRWKKTLHPARERVGKWSDDEDKRLKVAVTLFGKSWHKIAQFVPGRTQVQCRERWVNILDPSLNRGVWTEEDDLKLKAAIAEHGYCWSKVAASVPLRTDNQCRRKYKLGCGTDNGNVNLAVGRSSCAFHTLSFGSQIVSLGGGRGYFLMKCLCLELLKIYKKLLLYPILWIGSQNVLPLGPRTLFPWLLKAQIMISKIIMVHIKRKSQGKEKKLIRQKSFLLAIIRAGQGQESVGEELNHLIQRHVRTLALHETIMGMTSLKISWWLESQVQRKRNVVKRSSRRILVKAQDQMRPLMLRSVTIMNQTKLVKQTPGTFQSASGLEGLEQLGQSVFLQMMVVEPFRLQACMMLIICLTQKVSMISPL